MYFFIDNTKPDETAFFVSESGTDWKKEVFEDEGEASIEKAFEVVLQKEKITFADVMGVAVRVGVGRFTATRLAVTFANTLAFALKIPVLALTQDNPDGVVQMLKKTPVGQYASATYSGEPRLGGRDQK